MNSFVLGMMIMWIIIGFKRHQKTHGTKTGNKRGITMAKSVAVNVDIISLGENYKYVKYTYVYINDVDAKRKITRDNEALKGYHPMGKPRFSSKAFPDGSGAFWYAEYVYEKD